MRIIRNGKNSNFLLIGAILAISTASIFIRFAQESLSSLVIAAYRLTLASLFMLPFSLKETSRVLRKLGIREFGLLILSGIFLASHFAAWILSLHLTNVINSVVLVTTTPIWVALVSPHVSRERISTKFWVGLLIAFIGTLIVSGVWIGSNDGIGSGYLKDRLIGNGLALLGALCAAGYVIIGWKMRKTISNSVYTFGVYTIAAITLILVITVIPSESMRITFPDLKWLTLLALIPQLAGHSFINWFLGFRPAHEVSLYLLGEPIGSTVLAVVFLQEIPYLQDILGGFIILLGIGIAILGSRAASNIPE